jgi:hypothetical protein
MVSLLMVWWPKFLRKPRLRLGHIRLSAPPRPTTISLFLITLVIIAFLLGGGLFMYLNAGESWLAPVLTIREVNTALWPGLDRQLILEGLSVMLFVCGSFLGQIFVYEASKHAYRRSYAQRLLVIGWTLTIASFAAIWWMLAVKVQLAQG